ncbi:hypothetical protein HDV00_004050 [Rhizophlyctis rosea]|nr:hypothetical protein HDV00_004050 [Rhizophlyctis rosea]
MELDGNAGSGDEGAGSRHSRDKFRRERDDQEIPKDSFGRIPKGAKRDRERSQSSEDRDGERRQRRRRDDRSGSPQDRDSRPKGDRGGDRGERDTYIPDYSRNGYDPRPRYNSSVNTVTQPVVMMDAFGNPVIVPVPMETFDDRRDGRRRSGRVERPNLEDPANLDHLVPEIQFHEWLRQEDRNRRRGDPAMSDEEMNRRYQIYKENWSRKQQEKFFAEKMGEEWFREKYHPVDSAKLKEEVNRRRVELLAKFTTDLNTGKFDNVNFDEPTTAPKNTENQPAIEIKEEDTSVPSAPEDSVMKEAEPEEKQEKEGSPAPPAGANGVETADEPFFSLFIKSVHPDFKRAELIEWCSKADGFTHLALSDPKPDKKWHRLGWIVFKEGTDMGEAMKTLSQQTIPRIPDFKFHLALHHAVPIRTRVAPGETNRPERLKQDAKQIQELLAVLDEECGFPVEEGRGVVQKRLEEKVWKEVEAKDGVDESEVETAKAKKALDLYIEYARKVHNYDYYGGIESNSPEDHARRSAIYLRRPPSREVRPDWTERLDERVALRMSKALDGEPIWKRGGRRVETFVDNFLSKKFITAEGTGKFRCGECKKLFRGEEFVRKHLRSKHPNTWEDTKVECEYFNAYVRDPNKLEPWKMAIGVPGAIVPGQAGIGAAGPGGQSGMPGGVVPMPGMMGPMGPMMMPMMGGMPGMGMWRRAPPARPPRPPPPPPRRPRPRRRPLPRGGGGGRKSFGGDGGRAIQSRLGPPIGRDGRQDPRQIKSYTDLDQVASGDIEISYD